jgi:3-hydroxybutyryl-CoA dehydratase
MKYNEINIGDKASVTKIITEEMIRGFAEISGDVNPVHLDEEFAKGTIFGERIAHGILVTGLISNVLGNQLPGAGSIYASQSVTFLRPVKIGDEITASVEVIEMEEKRHTVKCRTICTNQNGKVVIKGEAVGIAPIE